MVESKTVYFGARVFDGEALREDCALVVEGGRIVALVSVGERPRGARQIDLGGGVLSPGFVDWQVNGGGGVLFNADPTPEGIAKIAAAHRAFGATTIVPTIITDEKRVLEAALAAARAAGSAIHVEGPFLDVRRKGVHRADFIRPITDADVAALIAAHSGPMIVTLAPSVVDVAYIEALTKAGIVVSLGHSEASAEQAFAAFDAGASAVTHIFNAMSPMLSREPGLVGAALARRGVVCGLIADGFHVADAAMNVTLAAKGAGAIALVSDSMSTAAGGPDTFALQGRTIRREGGRLTDDSGTLAGADIVMRDAAAYCVARLGAPLADALKMATSTPARLLGLAGEVGSLMPGAKANLLHLSDGLDLLAVLG